MFYVGLDLGQAGDPTALTVDELVSEAVLDHGGSVEDYLLFHHIRHAERFPLNTDYPKIVKKVKGLTITAPFKDNCIIIADATGVGRPVIDMLREAQVRVVPVMITAGIVENYNLETGFWNVPKRALVSAMQILFGEGRIKFARKIQEGDVIQKELMNFKIKVTSKGNDTYEAWRDGDHDDYVLALAISTWYANRFKPTTKKESKPHPLSQIREFSRW